MRFIGSSQPDLSHSELGVRYRRAGVLQRRLRAADGKNLPPDWTDTTGAGEPCEPEDISRDVYRRDAAAFWDQKVRWVGRVESKTRPIIEASGGNAVPPFDHFSPN
jgi:hypothetical protein